MFIVEFEGTAMIIGLLKLTKILKSVQKTFLPVQLSLMDIQLSYVYS